MTLLRRWRLFYWMMLELGKKYYRQIIFGLIIGSVSIVLTKSTILTIQKQFEKETEYIGVVGDYTISNIPSAILQNLSSGLTTSDETGSISGGLATSWEATDSGKTYIFHLKEGMSWHDGKEIVSEDVNYNIKGVTVEYPDDRTVIYRLPTSYSPFLTILTKPIFKKALVGFGPYTMSWVHFKAGSVYALTLSPENPTLSQKQYKFYKTDTQVILAYKQGEIDRIDGLADTGGIDETFPNTSIVPTISYDKMIALFFNIKDQMLSDKTFRQALSYGIPDIFDERATSPLSKVSWAYTDSVKKYAYDELQTKKLLEQSGMATTSATLTLHTFSPYLNIAQKIADSWTHLGIQTEVKVENALPSSYQALLTVRDVPPDPDQYAFWHSTQTNTNITGFSNPKIDKLLEDGRSEMDPQKRKDIYVDFQKRLVEEAPAVFLTYPTTYSIIRK